MFYVTNYLLHIESTTWSLILLLASTHKLDTSVLYKSREQTGIDVVPPPPPTAHLRQGWCCWVCVRWCQTWMAVGAPSSSGGNCFLKSSSPCRLRHSSCADWYHSLLGREEDHISNTPVPLHTGNQQNYINKTLVCMSLQFDTIQYNLFLRYPQDRFVWPRLSWERFWVGSLEGALYKTIVMILIIQL